MNKRNTPNIHPPLISKTLIKLYRRSLFPTTKKFSKPIDYL